MEIVAWVSLAISVASALFAGLVWKDTRRMADYAGDQLAIEQGRDKKAQDEQLSADVSVIVVWESKPRFDSNEPGSGRAVFRVINAGPATARVVDLVAEPQFGTTTQLSEEAFDQSPFPCDLAPGQTVDHRFVVVSGAQMKYQVSVSWADGAGQHEGLFQLSLPL